ncbi:uncharacterized protein B0T15DRAFT_486221 [Chaetomium strumarium]|uniref:Secreted protein n=1 Tax=Chaetomium strumarium TaxID=1170767 RepID=A0AAJ0GR87_9PEZI|nr:hypothetical protein B0T15DRAFT_486221 [Chaetomium strumarium]
MHRSKLYLLYSLPFALAQTVLGVTLDTYPTGPPGPNGNAVATARINFDLVGGFSNHPVHCEAVGPETCIPRGRNLTSGYTTMFRYRPSDPWDKLTLRETATCGTDPKQVSGVLFKGEVTANYLTLSRTGVIDRTHVTHPREAATSRNGQGRTSYYDDGHIEGSFILVDPAPFTNCNLGAPTWEVHGFSVTDFRLASLANNYTVGCSGHSNLSDAPSNNEWHICGVDPEDAPWLPFTMFRMDRQSQLLKVHQTWVCNSPDHNM